MAAKPTRSRSDSASSSSSLPLISPVISLLFTLVFTLVVLGGSTGPAEAKVFLIQQEALELAFPEADRIDSETFVLDETQTRAVEKQSRAALESRIVTIFAGWRGETLLGYAHIDIHTVRTEPEAFMVVLAPEGEVRSLRVLAFYEPLDYLPTKRWYRQFETSNSADLPFGMLSHCQSLPAKWRASSTICPT